MVTHSLDVRKMCIIFPNAVFFFDLYLFLPQEKVTPHPLTQIQRQKKIQLGERNTLILFTHSVLDEMSYMQTFPEKKYGTFGGLGLQ